VGEVSKMWHAPEDHAVMARMEGRSGAAEAPAPRTPLEKRWTPSLIHPTSLRSCGAALSPASSAWQGLKGPR
jgi:hypothetical protein